MQHEFFVATNGDDAWSGTLPDPNAGGTDGPLATLQRAIEVARSGSGDGRRIVVRGGAYYDVAVVLDDRDSGLTIEATEGEEPIQPKEAPLLLTHRLAAEAGATLSFAREEGRVVIGATF